jgi:hypothetical protein
LSRGDFIDEEIDVETMGVVDTGVDRVMRREMGQIWSTDEEATRT